VVQIEPLDAGDCIVLPPAIRSAIGATHEQPVQYGEERCQASLISQRISPDCGEKRSCWIKRLRKLSRLMRR
jgi:hypothetical protein